MICIVVVYVLQILPAESSVDLVISFQVKLSLPNGQVFNALYSRHGGSITDFRNFLINDVMMFTYTGNGNFDVVLFDQSGMEKTFSQYAPRTGN